MTERYNVERINKITYPGKRKKRLNSYWCKYLAKSKIVNCLANQIEFYCINFRGSLFSRVVFEKIKISGCDFWGTTFNNCTFNNVDISETVFMSCKFKNCTFKNTKFYKTIIVNTSLNDCNNIDISSGVTILSKYPRFNIMSDELKKTLDTVKYDKNLKKCKLLFISDIKYNNLNLYLLLQYFTEKELAILLLEICQKSTRTITTYKSLKYNLKKLKKNIRI